MLDHPFVVDVWMYIHVCVKLIWSNYSRWHVYFDWSTKSWQTERTRQYRHCPLYHAKVQDNTGIVHSTMPKYKTIQALSTWPCQSTRQYRHSTMPTYKTIQALSTRPCQHTNFFLVTLLYMTLKHTIQASHLELKSNCTAQQVILSYYWFNTM